MSEIGRPDSLVRGSCVFVGATCGVVMVARPELTAFAIAVLFVLAMIAANFVSRRDR